MSVHASAKRITTQVLQEMKHNGEKIAMLTAYDYSIARIVAKSFMSSFLKSLYIFSCVYTANASST